MKELQIFIRRNVKLFFKDKGLLFTSLITPAILLVLYITFLGNVYKSSLLSVLPEGITLSEKLIGGFVGGQLISSLLAVSCVTVSFCSNMLMVQDKITGARNDLLMTPLRPSVMALGYAIASAINTLIISMAALAMSLIYLSFVGFYLSFADVLLMMLNIILLVIFGTALSSIINGFLSSQAQISAVGTIVSSGYGFICGAYMPISQFSPALQKVITCLPGTYGTSLVRNSSLRGAFAAMAKEGVPEDAIRMLESAFDCKLSFFSHEVSVPAMYAVLVVTDTLLIGIYVLINVLSKKKVK